MYTNSCPISFEKDSNWKENIHKVFVKGKRTIVAGKLPTVEELRAEGYDGDIDIENETYRYCLYCLTKLPPKCYYKSYTQRVSDGIWEEEIWLSKEEANELGITILEDVIESYKKCYSEIEQEYLTQQKKKKEEIVMIPGLLILLHLKLGNLQLIKFTLL